jgi:type VI secretion system protein ImpK
VDPLQIQGSPLLRAYRAFFAEVLRFKDAIEASVSTAPPGDEPAAPAPATAAQLRAALLALIEERSRELGEGQSEFERQRRSELRYLMAGTADEVFINLAWGGRDAYKEDHLEHRLFQSHDAGERFFRNVEELLRRRDPSRVELAAVYLIALSLGFRGKYRDTDDGGRIEGYKRNLYLFVAGRDPDLSDMTRRFFSQAYAFTADERKDQRLAQVRPWALALAAVLTGYIVVGHVLWLRETMELRDAIELLQQSPRKR